MKRIGLLCLALVLALGSLGVAGALWSDWLYIDGYVETAYIGADWSIEYFYDNEEKDFTYINAYIWEDYPQYMFIDILNAYPSVTYTVGWDIHNSGSIPIHFDSPYMYGDLPAGSTFEFVAWDAAGTNIDLYGYQLHPCETIFGEVNIHLSNEAEQSSYYYFYIELQYGQYNEFP